MPNFTFNRNIPASSDNPSDDQPLMLTNNQSTNDLIAIDHVGFNSSGSTNNQGGYHTLLHMPQQTVGAQSAWNPATVSGVPAAISATKISGVQQVFSMSYTPNAAGATADTQLFALTGNGGISQLTGNSAATNGWVWMGGILLMWGVVINPGSSGSVTFASASGAIPFPNNIFSVQLTLQRASTGNAISTYIDNATPPTITGFNYLCTTTGNNKLFWTAIGN